MVAPPALISYIILESKRRLSVALSQMPVEEVALRTFVLMRSEMHGNSCHNGCVDHCPKMPVGNPSRPLTAVRDQRPISPVKCDVKIG